MAVCKTAVASWEAVATRVPRPGFFLGDDRAACPLSNDAVLLDDNSLPPSWDLGRLAVLPLELLQHIAAAVAEADSRALVALRNANRATAAIVDGMRDFAVVAAFPRALAAVVLLAPGPAGVPVSLSALAACLLARTCACCQRAQLDGQTENSHHPIGSHIPLGDCIYLLAPERVCYACFRGCPAYLPATRSPSASATSSPRPADDVFAALDSRPTSICVPPGRYGVLSHAEQSTELYDVGRAGRRSDTTIHGAHTVVAQPAPIRYAAVIPGPYWEDTGAVGRWQPSMAPPALDRGYGCLACVHTDRKTGYRGWADPLTRYTKEGLQQHLEDPRFGGRVLTWRNADTGVVSYEHDAPRRNRYPPTAEFGAMADMARKYKCEKTASGTAARWQAKAES